MKGMAIASKGLEGIASKEITELIKAECRIEDSCVLFEFKDVKELCILCYKSQSADRILNLIFSSEFGDFFPDFEKLLEKSKLEAWAKNCRKFRVECIRLGTHDFNSAEVESKVAGIILKKSKGLKVSIKEYEIIFFVYIVGNNFYFGIDFAGFELNKRSYKIFLHPSSLRGTIAYALVRQSGFEKKEAMLDPFSRDGVISIEAALFSNNFPVNYYKKEKFAFLKLKLGIDFEKLFKAHDKKIRKGSGKIFSYDHLFKYVDFSRKNAKIAGIDKQINFSRVELEWLDIKFKEKSIDRIVTNPPSSKNADLNKIYNEFFYQCAYILKENGTLALISKMPDFVKNYASKHNFSIIKETDVWSGEQKLKIMIFKNAKNLDKKQSK